MTLVYVWLFAMMVTMIIGVIGQHIPMPWRVEVLLIGILAGVVPSCALFTEPSNWWIGLLGLAITAVVMWPSVKYTMENLE